MLLEGQNNAVAVLQWSLVRGFHVDSFDASGFRDRWGYIHGRQMPPSFYDPRRLLPSSKGIEYLLPIFSNAIGHDDVEYLRQTLFHPGNLTQRYHSVNTDVGKRLSYLED